MFLQFCGSVFLFIFPCLSFHLLVDFFVELSLHKVALKPVSAHLYTCIHNLQTNDGRTECLQSNLKVLEKNRVEDLGGTAGAGVPDPVTLEQIQHKWTTMHEAYSPNKKVQILLKVCKTIYHSMSANASSGNMVALISCFLPSPNQGCQTQGLWGKPSPPFPFIWPARECKDGIPMRLSV